MATPTSDNKIKHYISKTKADSKMCVSQCDNPQFILHGHGHLHGIRQLISVLFCVTVNGHKYHVCGSENVLFSFDHIYWNTFFFFFFCCIIHQEVHYKTGLNTNPCNKHRCETCEFHMSNRYEPQIIYIPATRLEGWTYCSTIPLQCLIAELR
jgi:hypothetical protein